MPAFEALVPHLVPEDRLTEANALDQFVRPAMLWLLGPALGGVIIDNGSYRLLWLFGASTLLVGSLLAVYLRARIVAARESSAD